MGIETSNRIMKAFKAPIVGKANLFEVAGGAGVLYTTVRGGIKLLNPPSSLNDSPLSSLTGLATSALASVALFIVNANLSIKEDMKFAPKSQPIEKPEIITSVKSTPDETLSISQQLINRILSDNKLKETLIRVHTSQEIDSSDALIITSSDINLILTKSGFDLEAIEKDSTKEKITLRISLNELVMSAFGAGSNQNITVKITKNTSTPGKPSEILLPISLTAAAAA